MAQAEETIRPQKLTSADFAARIRAKHVGAYDDLSDDDLTRKVLTKYPQYADLTDMPAPSMPNEVKGTDFVMGENGAKPESIRTPETQSRVRNYKDLSKIVGGQGFTVTSTVGGRHNVGSAHYQGRAVDIRTRDKRPEEIEALMNNLRSSGIDVRDERVRPKGQEVWGGPHIHAQVSPPTPTPVNQTQDSTATPKRAVRQARQAARPTPLASPDPNFTFARPVRNDDFQQKLYQSERAARETQGQVNALPSKLERFMQSAATPGNVEAMATRPDPDAQTRTQLRRQVATERREQARVRAQVPDLSTESINREAEQRLQAGHENEAEQARLLGQFTPEDYANAKAIHDRIISEPRYARAIDAGLANVVGASVREVAGALNLPIRAVQALANTPGATQNETVDRLRRAALSAEMGAEQGKREAGFSRGEGLAQSGTELVGNLAKLALLTKGAGALGVPARAITPLVFGGQGVAAASGENKSLADVIAEGAKGAAEGELFNVAHELPMAADSIGQRLLRTGAQVGTVGAGTYGAERLAGASPEQAKQAALTNAAFVGVPAVAGEVARGVGEVAERRALRSRENDLQAAMLQREGVRPNEVETAPNLQETVVNEQGGQAPNLPPTQTEPHSSEYQPRQKRTTSRRRKGQFSGPPAYPEEATNADITQNQTTDTPNNITPTTTGGAGAQGGRTESRRTAQPLATTTSVSEVPANAPPQRTVEAQSTSRVVPSDRLAQTTGGQDEIVPENLTEGRYDVVRYKVDDVKSLATRQLEQQLLDINPSDPQFRELRKAYEESADRDFDVVEAKHPDYSPRFNQSNPKYFDLLKARSSGTEQVISPPALPTEKTQTPSSGWVDRLDEGTRESVFAEMRAVRAESDRSATQARNLSAPQGTIAVGAADFDPFIRAEAQATFLRELGKGKTPAEAETAAKQFAREAVVKHNAKRPNDVNWARWEGTADSVIERTRTRVERAAKGSVVPPTPTEKPTTLPTMPTESEKPAQREAKPLEQPISRQAGRYSAPKVAPEYREQLNPLEKVERARQEQAGESQAELARAKEWLKARPNATADDLLGEFTLTPTEAQGLLGARGQAEPQADYGTTNKFVTNGRYSAAKERVKAKLSPNRANAGLDPSVLADLAEMGAYHVEAGTREFAAWSKRMIEDAGEQVRPYLAELHKRSLAAVGEKQDGEPSIDTAGQVDTPNERVGVRPRTRPEVSTKEPTPKVGPPDTTRQVAKSEGVRPSVVPVTEREPTKERSFPKTLEAHGVSGGADRFYDEITDEASRQTAEQRISKLGADEATKDLLNRDKLGKDDLSVGLHLLREAVANGDAEREGTIAEFLSRKLTEAGQLVQGAKMLNTISPEGALIAAQKRLPVGQKLTTEQRANIKDAATSVQTAQKGADELDAKIAQARNEAHEDLKTQLVQAQERIKQLEKAQRTREGKGNIGQAIKDAQGRRVQRAQTKETLDRELDDLLHKFGAKASKFNANPFSDPELYSLAGKIARNRVRAGINTVEGLVDEVHSLLKEKFADLDKEDVRDAVYGEFQTKGPRREDAELRQLRQREAKIQQEVKRLTTQGPPKPTKLQDEIARLSGTDTVLHAGARKIHDRPDITRQQFQQEMAAEHNLSGQALSKNFVDSYKLVKDARQAAARSARESAVRRANPTADPPEVQRLIQERLNKQSDLRRAQQRLQRQFNDLNVSGWQRAGRALLNFKGAARAFTTSLAPFHSGFRHLGPLTLSHPITWMRAMVETARGLSTAHYDSMVSKIETQPNYRYMRKFHLGITTPQRASGNLSAMEEFSQSDWVQHIPIIKNSHQAFALGLDVARSELFNNQFENLKSQGYDPDKPADAKVFNEMANDINTWTRRANLPKTLEGSSVLAGQVFFTPRGRVAQFKQLFMPVRLAGSLVDSATGNRLNMPEIIKMSPTQRVENFRMMFGYAGFIGGQLALASFAGAKISKDLHIHIGNLHLDPTAGTAGQVKAVWQLAQVLADDKKRQKIKGVPISGGQVFEHELRSSLEPFMGAMYTGFIADKVKDKKTGQMTGSDFLGRPAYLLGRPGAGVRGRIRSSELVKAHTPMIFKHLLEGFDEAGGAKAVLGAGVGTFLGEGAEAYRARGASSLTPEQLQQNKQQFQDALERRKAARQGTTPRPTPSPTPRP